VSTLITLVVVLGVAVVALAAVYLSWVAGRHERLAARADAAWAGLDAQLVRRAAPTRTLAILVDDAKLAADAEVALRAGRQAREEAENTLGRALRLSGYDQVSVAMTASLPDAQRAALDDLRTAAARVQVARQIHNDAVRDLIAIRRRPAARVLRLGHGDDAGPGRGYFEIDDTVATVDGARGGESAPSG